MSENLIELFITRDCSFENVVDRLSTKLDLDRSSVKVVYLNYIKEIDEKKEDVISNIDILLIGGVPSAALATDIINELCDHINDAYYTNLLYNYYELINEPADLGDSDE